MKMYQLNFLLFVTLTGQKQNLKFHNLTTLLGHPQPNFLSSNPKYEQISLFSFLGGLQDRSFEPRGTKITGQEDFITEQTYA